MRLLERLRLLRRIRERHEETLLDIASEAGLTDTEVDKLLGEAGGFRRLAEKLLEILQDPKVRAVIELILKLLLL